MNFELDVSSSSSSSSSEGAPNNEDNQIDYDLRLALHLAVGKVCRAEEKAESSSNGNHHDGDDANLAIGSTGPKMAMSKEAISALTDLTYHYATTLLANDLVDFSSKYDTFIRITSGLNQALLIFFCCCSLFSHCQIN